MDKEKVNFKSLKARLLADIPYFWKVIRRWMIGCGTVGTALVAVPDSYVPPIVKKIAGYMVAIGVVGTALATLTVKSEPPPAIKTEDEKIG
jgi:hypothetical protein